MSSFLRHLIERSAGGGPEPITPRLPGPFELPLDVGPRLSEQDDEEESRPHGATLPLETRQETLPPSVVTAPSSPRPEKGPTPQPIMQPVDLNRPKQSV